MSESGVIDMANEDTTSNGRVLRDVRVAFVGAGVMAEAMIAGVLARRLVEPGQIVASRLGDRIVFSAIDKDVYTFRISADATADKFFDDDDGTDDYAWPRDAWMSVTAPNEPDGDTLARYGRLSTGNAFALTINGVDVSIGVAEWSAPMTGVSDLLRAADAQLYLAKQGGRNRVCSALPS